MKKIYLYFLLVMITHSILCMEQEDKDEIPLRSLYSRKSDNLMYFTSQHMMPIYIGIFHNVTPYSTENLNNATKKEQKLLLKTKSSLKVNSPIMQQLNKTVDYFIFDVCLDSDHKSTLDFLRNMLMYNTPFDEQCSNYIGYRLAHIIREMSFAKKKYNITEDIMGEYSYKITQNNYTAFFFSLLKKYNLITSQTKETLPFEKNLFYIVPAISSETMYSQAYNIHQHKSIMSNTYASQYPAFSDLVNNLHYILDESREVSINNIVPYFYTYHHPVPKNSLGKSIAINEFYKQACAVLTSHKSCEAIHKLLRMIDHTRPSTSISYENDLAHKMLTFDPTRLEIIFNTDFWNKDYLNNNTKNHINRLFTLIREYNTQKQNKVTPTITQYLAYIIKERLAIPLPDDYTSTIFDSNDYALIEFCYLIHQIDTLKKSFNMAQQDNV